jgi:hypothetical protein
MPSPPASSSSSSSSSLVPHPNAAVDTADRRATLDVELFAQSALARELALVCVTGIGHIQKSVTGLADAKLSKLMPKMRIFDDNVAEVLFFFENPVIEAPLNREIHF